MKIDDWGKRLWARLRTAQKAAFFSCMIAGYIVHLYAFTNIVPNADGLSRVNDAQQMTVSGRWFLHYASVLNDYTQMPAVIGFLSLLFLSLAVLFVVDLLGIRSGILGGLVGAIWAAFPCMGYTFLYLFTASAYCLAILLAVLSVWLVRRKGLPGFVAGVVLLALAMGIYQAYVTVAISLALLVILREFLHPKANMRGTLLLGVRHAVSLGLGAALYYVMLQIFLKAKGLTLLSYLGMDAADAGYPLGQIPALLGKTYAQTAAFFFDTGAENSFANDYLVVLDILTLWLILYFLISLLAAQKLHKTPWRLVGSAAMLLLLPLGMNFGQMLSPYSTPTPIMKYAFVSVYLLALQLADMRELRAAEKSRSTCAAALCAVLLLVFCLNTNNLLYTASAQAHRATESYLTRLVSRIEDCDGYESGMEVVIIGTPSADDLRAQVDSYAQVKHYSLPTDSLLTLNKHVYYYLNDWLNFPVEEPSEETMLAVSDSEEFQDMAIYPAQGSVQVMDGRVVVRLSEQYRPKEEYEIAYENRR